jgi:hypothetical protein
LLFHCSSCLGFADAIYHQQIPFLAMQSPLFPCQSIRCRFYSKVCSAIAFRRHADLFHSDPVLCRSSAPHSQSHAPPIIAVAPLIKAAPFRFVSNQSQEKRFFATPFLIAARRFFASSAHRIAVSAVAFSADPCSSTP